jgi:[ribosomal protein S5]-alanine N-acetyltransferase
MPGPHGYDHAVTAEIQLPSGYDIRPLSESDGPALTDAQQRNRAHLAPWSPRRADSFYTQAGQQEELSRHLQQIAGGQMAAFVVVHGDRIVGRINLHNIVRGAFQSADLGYWIDQDEQNKGLATAAVRTACEAAADLGLHRLAAGTLIHNERSQNVLLRCGFTQYGTAPDYLFIDGSWQDHKLYQRILHDSPLALT